MVAKLPLTHLARRWVVILAVSVVVAVAFGAWSSTRAATYRAAADVLLPPVDESTLIGQQRLVEASSELAATTAAEISGASAADVASAIDVRRQGTVLTIVATGATPALVRDIANVHAATYLRLGGPGSLDGTDLIRLADVPAAPIAPRPLRDGAVVGLVSLFPSAFVVLLWSTRRDQIRSGADVRSAARVLVELPLDEGVDVGRLGLSAAESPDVDYVAAVESLFSKIRPAQLDRARRILITGTDADADASQLAANLAWVAASNGWRTVVVGGDGRARRLEQLLSPYVIDVSAEQRRAGSIDALVALPGTAGRDHLAGAVAGDHVMQTLVPTRAPNLCLLPWLPGASDADPAAMLASDVVGAVLDHLDGIADLIIIDSPAVDTADDAYLLAPRTDDVVVVAAARSTSLHQLAGCIRRLDQDRPRVRGVVVNRVRCSVHRPSVSSGDYARPRPSSSPTSMPCELAPAAVGSGDRIDRDAESP